MCFDIISIKYTETHVHTHGDACIYTHAPMHARSHARTHIYGCSLAWSAMGFIIFQHINGCVRKGHTQVYTLFMSLYTHYTHYTHYSLMSLKLYIFTTKHNSVVVHMCICLFQCPYSVTTQIRTISHKYIYLSYLYKVHGDKYVHMSITNHL